MASLEGQATFEIMDSTFLFHKEVLEHRGCGSTWPSRSWRRSSLSGRENDWATLTDAKEDIIKAAAVCGRTTIGFLLETSRILRSLPGLFPRAPQARGDPACHVLVFCKAQCGHRDVVK